MVGDRVKQVFQNEVNHLQEYVSYENILEATLEVWLHVFETSLDAPNVFRLRCIFQTEIEEHILQEGQTSQQLP